MRVVIGTVVTLGCVWLLAFAYQLWDHPSYSLRSAAWEAMLVTLGWMFVGACLLGVAGGVMYATGAQ